MSIQSKIQVNYPLAPLSTFKIGGEAEYFIEIDSQEDLEQAFVWAKEDGLTITLLGGGSNILISDSGIKGLVVKLNNQVTKLDKTNIICEASSRVWDVAQLAMENSLTDMEWAIGIPGSIGGAVRGNAGAHGGSFDQIVELVTFFNTRDLSWQDFTNKQCGFAYRDSIFKKQRDFIIWQVKLNLSLGNKPVIEEMVKGYRQYRQDCQPKEPSAGCIFKNLFVSDIAKANPELAQIITSQNKSRGGKVGAGYLIEQLNLKGKSFGGAKISEMHANFIINNNHAKASDVLKLINMVKEAVKNRFNISLEEEVQYLGF